VTTAPTLETTPPWTAAGAGEWRRAGRGPRRPNQAQASAHAACGDAAVCATGGPWTAPAEGESRVPLGTLPVHGADRRLGGDHVPTMGPSAPSSSFGPETHRGRLLSRAPSRS